MDHDQKQDTSGDKDQILDTSTHCTYYLQEGAGQVLIFPFYRVLNRECYK